MVLTSVSKESLRAIPNIIHSMLRVAPCKQSLVFARLCSSRAWWPVGPNFCSRVTRKSLLFHRNHALGTLDFKTSEHWATFDSSWNTALVCPLDRGGEKEVLPELC